MNAQAKALDGDAPGRRSVLVEAAVTTLAEAGRPMTLQQLARAVLHVEAGGAHVGARILAPLLEADDRLATVAVGHVGLAAWLQRSDAIDETEFVVFDIETNGGRGGRHRVLEVGALRLRAGREISRYASLARIPGRVSKFVTRYTGITDEMLVDAPPVETVLDEFREFQAGGVLVAHNLPTDLGYLNREAVWAGRALFAGDGLDTMELSAALLPDLPGTGLATVLEAAGISDSPTHRALDDAGSQPSCFSFSWTKPTTARFERWRICGGWRPGAGRKADTRGARANWRAGRRAICRPRLASISFATRPAGRCTWASPRPYSGGCAAISPTRRGSCGVVTGCWTRSMPSSGNLQARNYAPWCVKPS